MSHMNELLVTLGCFALQNRLDYLSLALTGLFVPFEWAALLEPDWAICSTPTAHPEESHVYDCV